MSHANGGTKPNKKICYFITRYNQKVNVVRCSIWYYLYNLKNVKNTHGGRLILVKLQYKSATLLKLTLLHGCFSRFLNCTNGTKSRNASQMKNTSSFHVFNTRYCYNFISNVTALVLTLELQRIFYILKQDNINQNYYPFSKNGNTF